MERSKLKNIILTILVITNVLLLGLTLFQQAQSRRARQQVMEDAVELLAQQGITAQAGDLPDRDFPPSQLLERDAQAELTHFAALLGQDTAQTQRGLVTLYTGSLGTAETREDGAFSVELEPGAYPLADGQDLAQHAARILERLGIRAKVTAQGGNAVTAVETLRGVPVFTCAVELRYEGGELRGLSGTRLAGSPSPDPQAGECLSTATLLVRFRAGIITSGDTCTAIRSATQGYHLSADANRNLRLTPVLRLETDTNLYLLNALTGELQRA